MGLYSYTVLEAPLPRISWYCNKQNMIKQSEKHGKMEKRQNMINNILCHIYRLDQLQQNQSHLFQAVSHNSCC